jgi:hypothetical protein
VEGDHIWGGEAIAYALDPPAFDATHLKHFYAFCDPKMRLIPCFFAAIVLFLGFAGFSSPDAFASADLGADFRIHHCHSNASASMIDFRRLKQQFNFVSFESWGPQHGVAGNLEMCLNSSTKVRNTIKTNLRLIPTRESALKRVRAFAGL